MENVKILSVEIIKLCIPILIGFICVKTGYVKQETTGHVSKLIAKVLFPIMMFCIFMDPSMSMAQVLEGKYLLLTAVVWVVFSFIIGLAVAKSLRLEGGRAPVFMILTGMSNVTYMGIPLCVALFGETFGRLGVALVSLAGHLAMWTVGVLMMSLFSDGKKKFSFKTIVSPVTIAIALAILLKVTGVTLPALVYAPLSTLGGTTPYVALVFIGMIIGAASFKELVGSRGLLTFLVLKQLILPLLFGLLMHWFGAVFLDAPSRGLLMVEHSTSAMISLTPYFKESGYDADYAAQLVFTSTLLSIVTIPLVMFINSLY